MRAPHLKLVTDSRTVKQAYLENFLRLWLEVVDLVLKDMTLGLAPRLPRSKFTRLLRTMAYRPR